MKINKIYYIIKKYLRSDSENGQSALEFILLLPFIIVVFLVFFQLGCCIYLQNNIEQSAREAARVISTTNSNDRAKDIIRSNLSGKTLVIDDISFIPADENTRRTGDYVKVKISIRYGGFLNLPAYFAGQKIILEAESIMRMECGGQAEY